MSNLKDTDIDDLFRRASDKYPLRTDSSDWDKMSAALEKDPPPPADGTATDDQRKRRRFFWLFVLLPLGLGGLGYYAWHSGHTGAKTQSGTTTSASVSTHAPAATTEKDSPSVGTTPGASTTAASTTAASTTAATATATPAKGTSTTTGPTIGASTTTSAAPVPATPATVPTANAITGTSNPFTSGTSTSPTTSHKRDGIRGGGVGHYPSNTNNSTNTNSPADQNGAFGDANTVIKSKGDANQAGGGELFSVSSAQHPEDRLFYDLQRAPIDRNYQLKVNVVAPSAKKDSNATKQKNPAKTKTSYFYAGIIGAPDLSTVKMQTVKAVGNTFGILAGYAFNSHWAIETGAYLERKKYYTEGQYFSIKEVTLPSNDTLSNVNGTCYMWEIPLNVRYTFNPGAKTKWFAVAGFSTYLMTSEKYTYGYEYYGGGTSWPGTSSWDIKKPSQYPFSIVNLSAGFEQRLGKVGNLRVEPYVRLPLTGMGTGKLPIMSTGINIGITRQLW